MKIKKEVSIRLDKKETDNLLQELNVLFSADHSDFNEEDFPDLFSLREHLIRYKRSQS